MKRKKIKARIINCTRNLESESNCWYKDRIGEVIRVYKCSGEHEKIDNKKLRLCDREGGKTGKINLRDLHFF
ncbi:MAG: hypothetical protein KGY74_10660 [Candidatus Cloacimonetes bacterium]|nr:hypothetical protein [Candidatus Cloacimonadota bacterium]